MARGGWPSPQRAGHRQLPAGRHQREVVSMAAGVRGGVGGDHADQICMPGFIGREQEVATLARALTGPSVVLVEGEAGIGKSRLVQELLATARSGHRILIGVCPPYRESLTLGPI